MEQPTIVMLKGLPASGKTKCYEEEYAPQGYIRISLREIKENLPIEEKKNASKVRNFLIKEAIENQKKVVLDDCNLSPLTEKNIRILAKKQNVSFMVDDRFLDVPLEDCIENDLKRPDSVGAIYIQKLYNQYIYPSIFEELDKNWDLKRAIIINLETVLQKKVSKGINLEIKTADPFIATVIDAISSEMDYYSDILIISTLPEEKRQEVVEWLDKFSISYTKLFMNDGFEDDQDKIKEDIFLHHIKDKWAILGVIESDFLSYEMWRKHGLQTLKMEDRLDG